MTSASFVCDYLLNLLSVSMSMEVIVLINNIAPTMKRWNDMNRSKNLKGVYSNINITCYNTHRKHNKQLNNLTEVEPGWAPGSRSSWITKLIIIVVVTEKKNTFKRASLLSNGQSLRHTCAASTYPD